MSNQNEMLHDLVESLQISNVHWTSWEREFIESIKLKTYSDLSPKHRLIVVQLWEKI